MKSSTSAATLGLHAILLIVALMLAGAANARDRTQVYFHGSGETYYFSELISLPYADSDIIYSRDGQQALKNAMDSWVNRVRSRHGEALPSGGLRHVLQQSHLSDAQFERARIEDVEHYRNIPLSKVRIVR